MRIVNGFIEKLCMISQIKNSDEIQQYFKDVANYLFNRVAISAGADKYTFIEVEFYYYQKGMEGMKGIFEGPVYNCTYPRTRKAGQFFWHLSGLDICFESSEKNEFFGGILIRSLLKNGTEIIAGPMRCMNELMNSCETGMPTLVEKEQISKEEAIPTARYGIAADEDSDVSLGYYIKPKTWQRERLNVLVANKSGGYDKRPKKIDYYPAQPENRKK